MFRIGLLLLAVGLPCRHCRRHPRGCATADSRSRQLIREACRTTLGSGVLCGRITMVRRVSQLVAVALTIVIVALPLSACLTSAAEMSKEERECCKKMTGRCETSVMPSSHSCCQHPVSRQAIAVSRVQMNDSVSAIVMLAEAIPVLPELIVRRSSTSFESPPESPPQISNVLRI
jgi:hypothetical protein